MVHSKGTTNIVGEESLECKNKILVYFPLKSDCSTNLEISEINEKTEKHKSKLVYIYSCLKGKYSSNYLSSNNFGGNIITIIVKFITYFVPNVYK